MQHDKPTQISADQAKTNTVECGCTCISVAIHTTWGNLWSTSSLVRSLDLRGWIWMLQVYHQQWQRPSNAPGLFFFFFITAMSWSLWAVVSGSVSHSVILLESKHSVSHWHSLLVCGRTFPDAFQATSECRFSRTTLLLSLSFTKRASEQQALSVHSSLYAVRTCCLSGAPFR